MSSIPLGKQEGQGLEFMSAETLKDPHRIARAVVAMLNAGEGQIWIGLEETDGFATRVGGVSSAAAQVGLLRDTLRSTVEPCPDGGDVDLTVVPGTPDRDLLHVEIKGDPAKRPYAVLKDGGRHYLVRVDHRLRPMSREEILEPNHSSTSAPARDILTERRRRFVERREDCFWIGLQPVVAQRIEVQDARLSELIENPELSGNRRSGWNFRSPHQTPTSLTIDSLVRGSHESRRIEIHKDCGIELSMPLSWLTHSRSPGEETTEVYPLALLEYAVSIPRLAKAITESFGLPPTGVLMDIALLGAEGWYLPAYPPGTYGYSAPPPWEDNGTLPGPDLLFASPREFSAADITEFPDWVGYHLARAVYQAFGLTADRMPSEFKTELGRLELRD